MRVFKNFSDCLCDAFPKKNFDLSCLQLDEQDYLYMKRKSNFYFHHFDTANLNQDEIIKIDTLEYTVKYDGIGLLKLELI